MIDEYVNKNKVVAYMVWAAVVGLMAMAWAVLVLGEPEYAAMLAATGCATSAFAATLHIRCYMTRIACLVRGPALESPSGPRALRDL